MPVLQIHLKPSNSYFIIMVFILLGALTSIFCSLLPYYIQLLLSLVALLYGGNLIWKEVLLKGPRALVTLTCCDDNTWQLKERSGEEYQAYLCGDSARLGFVSILRFKGSGQSLFPHARQEKKRSSVVFHDAIGSAAYRRLLMKLSTIKIY